MTRVQVERMMIVGNCVLLAATGLVLAWPDDTEHLPGGRFANLAWLAGLCVTITIWMAWATRRAWPVGLERWSAQHDVFADVPGNTTLLDRLRPATAGVGEDTVRDRREAASSGVGADTSHEPDDRQVRPPSDSGLQRLVHRARNAVAHEAAAGPLDDTDLHAHTGPSPHSVIVVTPADAEPDDAADAPEVPVVSTGRATGPAGSVPSVNPANVRQSAINAKRELNLSATTRLRPNSTTDTRRDFHRPAVSGLGTKTSVESRGEVRRMPLIAEAQEGEPVDDDDDDLDANDLDNDAAAPHDETTSDGGDPQDTTRQTDGSAGHNG